MATSVGPVPAVCVTRGMPFAPTNGVAAVQRNAQVEAQIRETTRQAQEEARQYHKTRKGTKAWGK